MRLVHIYECLCDATRLRILNALLDGPLCVCHLQTVLGEPQVKISKHLAYLKRHGMVEAERQGHWMIHRLTTSPSAALRANLACLQDCTREDPVFARDRRKRASLLAGLAKDDPVACCPPAPTRARRQPSKKTLS